MKESTIENDGRKYALELGMVSYKFKSVNNRAVPDRLFINRQGVTFYIEYKAPGEKPSDAQKRKAKEMGHPVTPIFWADSKEVSRFIIKELSSIRMTAHINAWLIRTGLDKKYTCFDI